MKILGIDPGTAVMGWGVIEGEGTELALVDFGAIIVKAKTNTAFLISIPPMVDY